MIWIITVFTFLAAAGVILALVYAFSPGEVSIASRLARLAGISSVPEEATFANRQKERVRDTLANVGKILPAPSTEKTTRTQLLMIRAGYRSPEALLAMRGVKLIFPIVALAGVYFSGLYRINAFFFPVVTLALGYLIPDMWLTWRVSARKFRLRRALPDALDLLVICVEAGLGLDQALMKVAQDMKLSHPELSEELQFVNLEMRIGKTRIDALRELARRTGLDDIKSLTAMLIQTERFGTSVAQSLRGVHSIGMLFPIDLVFLNKERKVVHVEEHFRPFRVSKLSLKATSVLELPPHTIYRSGTQVGDVLEITKIP